MTKYVPLLVAAVSGIAMALQGTVNARLSQKTGIWEATFLVHLIGTITVGILLLFLGLGALRFDRWLRIPWYLYLGGLLSVLIIYLVALSIPKVGVCNATTAIIVGQVSAAVIIDHFGLFGVQKLAWSYIQLLGVAFFAVGARLLMR